MFEIRSIGLNCNNNQNQNCLQMLPLCDPILVNDPLDLIKMDEILKQDSIAVDNNEINSNNPNNIHMATTINFNNNNNKRKKLLIDSFSCNCIANGESSSSSSKIIIEQLQQKFHLLIRYMQIIQEFNFIKTLHWTKAIVDQNIWKVCFYNEKKR